MIFFGIVDPQVSNANLGLEQQIAWCRDYCVQHRVSFEQPIILETRNDGIQEDITRLTVSLLKDVLSEKNADKLVYIYFNTHGITEKEGESIELNKMSYISDRTITEILFENKVQHVTVFFECCHSAGFFEPSDKYARAESHEIVFLPRYNYQFREPRTFIYWPNNITVFNTSLVEQESFQITQGPIGSGLATLELRKLNKNPLDCNPEYVAKWLNMHIGEQQYATVQCTDINKTWF